MPRPPIDVESTDVETESESADTLSLPAGMGDVGYGDSGGSIVMEDQRTRNKRRSDLLGHADERSWKMEQIDG